MALTCNACCHGRSDTFSPVVSVSHHQDIRQGPFLLTMALKRFSAITGCSVQRVRRRYALAAADAAISGAGQGVPAVRRCHGGRTAGHVCTCVHGHSRTTTDAAITEAGRTTTDAAIAGAGHTVQRLVGRRHGLTTANAAIAGADQTVDDSLTDHESTATLNVPDYVALPSIRTSKRVVLVRHGQSTWNAEGRIQGSSDFAVLTPKGEIQAETSRQMLLSDSFDVCFHSPLARAKSTAEIIWGPRTNPMIPVHDLREIDLYGFQGLMKNEGKERYRDTYKTWQKDAANFLIDGHYPVRELWTRAQKCWGEILHHEGQSILVVAHNAVNQALVATATGLGPEYFRLLLQSNCGVSVLDFTPRSGGDGPPHVCLDRLNQTPSPPVAGEQGSGRKVAYRIILVCHGATDSSVEKRFAVSKNESLNMLGIIQSRKTAELLLDVTVNSVLSSPQPSARKTAEAIVEVQEAADCLGADCAPRYVEAKQLAELEDLDWGQWKGRSPAEVVQQDRWQDFLQHEDIIGGESVTAFWERVGCAWESVLGHAKELDVTSSQEKNVVVVGHELTHTAMLGHCLGLTSASIGSFHVDTGSLSVIDLPDGPSGKGVVRCLNYTAHLGRWAVPITRPTLADEDF